jgi:hypothetical protein
MGVFNRFSIWFPGSLQTLFSEHLFEHRNIQHGIGQEQLQLGVLILLALQPFGLRDLHPAVFGTPFVKSCVVDATFAAKIRRSQTSLMLL